MNGFALAGAICAISVVVTAAIVGMVFGLISWLGEWPGGIISISVVMLGMFLTVGIATRDA